MEREIINYILQNKEKHYRIAYSYVKNKEDALDIIQDTIVKALKYQHTLKHIEYLHTWFCRILINTCKTYFSKQGAYIVLSDEEHLASESTQIGKTDSYENLEIGEALDALNETERAIISLRYFEDLELKDIASVTNQNLSTIKSTLYRALKKLKTSLSGKPT